MKREDMNENPSRIPEDSHTKPMDSNKDVEKSPDAKTDQDFPGYPHYPAKEDIMDQRTGSHRVDANVENMVAGPNASGMNERYATGQQRQQNNDDDVAEGETSQLATTDSAEDEIGNPQNVSNEEVNEATETGSLNP